MTAVRAVSISGSHSPPRLPRMPSSTVRISGPAVRAAHIVIWSYSCILLVLLLYSCLQCPQLSELALSELLLWELSMTFYIFHRYRVCLVDRVDLIRSLYSWWEGFGSSSLATLLLSFNCGFISTSTCGSSIGVSSWGCPGGLGFAPVRAKWGGGAAAWVTGVLASPGTPGGWWLGQQGIQCSGRVWQQVMSNTLQYSCLDNISPWQRSLAGHSPQGHRAGHDPSNPVCIEARRFFACGSSAPVRVEHEGGAAAWLAGTLAAPSVQGHGLPLPQELWPYHSLFSSLL